MRGTLVLAVNCVFVFVFGVSNAARSLDIVIKDDDFRETVLIGNVCWKSVWREGGRGAADSHASKRNKTCACSFILFPR